MNKDGQLFEVNIASAKEMLSVWEYESFEEATPTARFFYENIESGNAVFWSVRCVGEIVGELYTFYDLEDKDFADGRTTAYLCAFRVEKSYRGQGLGSMLMEAALSHLKENGYTYATIGVGMTEEDNKAMYRHMGFNTTIKDCFFDPCARDKKMKPKADEGFILLSKEL